MLAVIFEVWSAAGRKDDYLKMAAALKQEVGQIDASFPSNGLRVFMKRGKVPSGMWLEFGVARSPDPSTTTRNLESPQNCRTTASAR